MGVVSCMGFPIASFLFKVRIFSAKGLKVGCVTGSTASSVLSGVRKAEYQLVYFTPEELLLHRKWRELFQSEEYVNRLKVLVIDEAHTIKKWYKTV